MEITHENDGQTCIQEVLNGNHEAYRDFILLYQRLVFSIANKLISCREDRDDICQEVFIKAYQNLANFKGECKISTWIAKITYNTCINTLRRKKTSPLNDSIDFYSESANWPDTQFENQDLCQRVQQEIDRLPVILRTALTLYHQEGLKYDEIARVMNLPEGTIKSHLFRARQLLKKRLLIKYEKEELLQ